MRQHDEGTKFIAYALWLAGYSAGIIGHWLGMRRPQALGLCQRSPWGNRAAMSLQERQKALDELRAIRIGADGRPLDGGRLSRFDWKAMALNRAQERGRVEN